VSGVCLENQSVLRGAKSASFAASAFLSATSLFFTLLTLLVIYIGVLVFRAD